MHFRASCAYAALAELVWREGVDTEDERIVREMDLPYLFTKEENAFAAGTMLQGAAWFELWLKPHGFAMHEQTVVRSALSTFLRNSGSCMLGLLTPGGRHAVVYDGFDGRYHFGNPVPENSGESEAWSLSEAELLAAADDTVTTGTLQRVSPETVNKRPLLQASITCLSENVHMIEAFADRPHLYTEYDIALDNLFRPLLLDGITMLSLIDEDKPAEALLLRQQELLSFYRGDRTGLLCDTMSLPSLRDAAEQYAALIRRRLSEL